MLQWLYRFLGLTRVRRTEADHETFADRATATRLTRMGQSGGSGRLTEIICSGPFTTSLPGSR